VNHCHLFEEQEDYEKMLVLLATAKEDLPLLIHAYCLLSNHVHLLVQAPSSEDIAQAMRMVLGPYANWFNRKYLRSGALIANRYRSECVEDDRYLLALVRYIHQNPVAAGASRRIGDYRWSSYREYSTGTRLLTDTGFILAIFSEDPSRTVEEFKAFHSIIEPFEDALTDKAIRVDGEIYLEVRSILKGAEPHTVTSLPRAERDDILACLRERGFSIRQIERVTGISRGIVARAKQLPDTKT